MTHHSFRFYRALAVPALLLLTAACDRSSEVASAGADVFRPGAETPADTGWVKIEGVEFPAGMEDTNPEVLEAYIFAAQHPEVLQYMPCYCGCEHPRTGHTSNLDCFVDMIDRSGELPRVSPDPMGFS